MRQSAVRRLTAVSLFLLAALPATPASAQALKPTGHSVPGEVLVNVVAKSSKADVDAIAKLGDVDDSQHVADLRSGAIWRMHSRGKSTEALMTALQKNPKVTYVEPNYVVQISATPNDPLFSQEYGLSQMIGADKAWDVTTGSASIVVGVVDTGINYDHPDLAPNVWSNPGGKGKATCAAGTHGYNALNGTCDPMDTHYHGTHVSGTIGAVGNNNLGVTGVNWTTSIMGLKFLDSNGNGTIAGAIAAIDFAVQAKIDGVNVRVLSNSWGGFPFSKALLDEINKAAENDILFVASAGNSSIDNDGDPHYPSSYTTTNMIAVAATDSLDQLASFSNYGLKSVHLGAPGVSVLSTYYDGYGWLSGTSMAAPHVAGAAALLLAQSPSLTTAQVKSAILANVEPIPALAGKTVSGGRLSLARMFGASEPADFSISISPATQTVVAGEPATFTVTVNGEPGFSDRVWLYTSGLNAAGIVALSDNPATTSSSLTVWTVPGAAASTQFTVSGESSRRRHTADATLVTTPAPSTCMSFGSSSALGEGNNANAVAVADFDRDGRPDFAAADVQRDRVAVFVGGSTGFTTTPVGRSPIFIASADVNGDGKSDLITANSGSSDVSVLLGNGNGTFAPAVAYASGASPFAVATGDFNRDGRVDLVTANNASASVSILLGNGDGTFQAPASYSTSSGAYWVSVADLNRDGKMDLVVANYNADNVSVLAGNGDGTFAPAKQYATGDSPSAVAVGDWNGDGQADLAVANYASNFASILAGNGDGTFAAATQLALAGGATSVAAGDLDGDGMPDLVFATTGNSVVAFRGKGDGTFAVGPIATSDALNHLLIADANGDGRLDVVTAGTGYANGYTGVIRTLLNSSTCTTNCGVIGSAVSYAAGAGAAAIVAGDFNGDGKADAAVTNAEANSVSVFLGNGGGAMQPAATYAAGSAPRGIATGDLNGDGISDLVIAYSSSNAIAFLAGNANGTFGAAVTQAVGTSPEAVAIADLNRDGKLDVVSVNRGSNSVSILRGRADGTFASRLDVAAGSAPVAVTVADFNVDGLLDLAVANGGSNNVSILLGYGDGNFQPGVSWAAGSTPSSIAAGDLNRDGRPDLVVANAGSNNVSVLIGTAAGFATQVTYATGASPSSVVIADLGRDGKPDLAVTGRNSNDLYTLPGNGDGTFGSAVVRALGTGPSSLVAADFNRDGRVDLAASNAASNDMAIALGMCPAPDLVVSKSHSGTFTPGDTARMYTIVVTNAGEAATRGVVSVADSLPRGLSAVALSGSGWTCSLFAVTCTREDALGAGGSYPPILLTVRVGSTASGTVTNTVAVSGGGETNRANDTADDPTQIAAVADLVVSSVHSGDFTQGAQAGTYTIVVRNAGGLATSGTITVTDTLPAGFTATSISGSGWSCAAATLTCQRNDSIPGGSTAAPITVTFNISADAPSGANVVSVSGGGESDTTNDIARDATTVWRRDACGGLTPEVTYAVPYGGFTLASGDLDGDGNLDLVVGTSDTAQGLAVLLGRSDGSFAQASIIPTTNAPGAVRVADFDGDGRLDILMTRRISSSMQALDVLRGNGNGSFGAAAVTEFASTAYYPPSAVVVADFNRDGVLDVVLSEDSYGYTVLPGRGDGTFSTPARTRFQSYLIVNASADLNRDGHADLIARSYPGVSVLFGDGNGAFGAPVTYNIGVDASTVTVCDLNGDGVADLAVGGYTGIVVLTGDANGTFTARPLVSLVAGGVKYIRVADINGDSKQDLIASSSYYGLYSFLGDGSGSLGSAGKMTSWTSDGEPIVGDFDHDGALDVARVSTYSVQVSLGGCADLTLTKSHYGSFSQGQTNVYYTIRVKNLGPASSATVTVVDQLPAGLKATSMSGYNWNCDVDKLTCTSTSATSPGFTYYDITVGVSVAADAPASVVNTATVSAAADRNPANNTASDPTTIVATPDLAISMTHTGAFGRGQTAVYNVIVKNVGTVATTGFVYVDDQAPPGGLTIVSMSGTGWTCQVQSCKRSDALAPGSAYPVIVITATVSPNAPQTLTNVAAVSGYNEMVMSNNSASDVTQILWEPTNVIATMSGPAAVTVTWTGVAGATGYAIYRTDRITNAFAQIGATGQSTFTDVYAQAGKSYLYQVRALDGTNFGGPGLPDLASVVSFSDDPIVANTTTMKAAHILELRTAANAVRALAALSPVTFADGIGSGVFIKASHIQELRTAVDAARSALGLPAMSYIDPSIGGGYLMKASHIQQLRAAVK